MTILKDRQFVSLLDPRRTTRGRGCLSRFRRDRGTWLVRIGEAVQRESLRASPVIS